MQTYQKELSNNRTKLDSIDLIVLLLLFPGPILNCFLFISGRSSESGQLVYAYILILILSCILFVKYYRRYILPSIGYVFVIFVIIAFGFVMTYFRYGSSSAWFVSEFKAYIANSLCIFLVFLLIFWSGKNEVNLDAILVFDIFLSIVTFISLINGRLYANGLIHDESGFLYQNISYYGANCIGINMFLLKEYIMNGKKRTIINFVLFALSLLNLFTCFTSGGRGGAVLAVILLLFGVISIFGFSKAIKAIVFVIIGTLIFFFVFPRLVSLFGINLSGYTRVLSLLNVNVSDSGRIVLIKNAMVSFNEHPLIGNGIGSIFYLINSYSHNVFVDILAETGLVGLIISIIVLAAFVRCSFIKYNNGSLYRFLLCIFICGFTMNLFSGYIWVNPQVWLPLVVYLALPKQTHEANINPSEQTNIDLRSSEEPDNER